MALETAGSVAIEVEQLRFCLARAGIPVPYGPRRMSKVAYPTTTPHLRPQ